MDIMIEQYDKYLSDLLDRHAPKKNIYVVDRPLNEWMTDDILVYPIEHLQPHTTTPSPSTTK